MSAISNFLTFLRSAIYAIDVRDGIADAIEQCYNDVNNPTLKTEALEAALQTKIDEGEMAALTIGDHTITAAKLANGVIPAADATLTETGKPADAAETGRQIGLLKADLDAQVADINESLGVYAWHRKGFVNLTTDPVSLTPTSNMGIDCLIADCSAGDIFSVTASGGVSSRAWGFLDSGNHVLTVADENTHVDALEITAPTNAAKLVINNIFSYGEGIVYKVGNNLTSRVTNLETTQSDMEEEIQEAKDLISQSGIVYPIPYDFYTAVTNLLVKAYYRENPEELEVLKHSSSLYVYDSGIYLSQFYDISAVQSCRTILA